MLRSYHRRAAFGCFQRGVWYCVPGTPPNDRSGTVIAMAITSQPQRAEFPLSMELLSSTLPKRSWVKISQIRTLSADRIGDLIDTLPPEQLSRLIDGLNEIIS